MPMKKQEYHFASLDQAALDLETRLDTGLTAEQAQTRLGEYGTNELLERPRPGFLKMLLDQFNNFLIIILIAAALISLLIGEVLDASAIMAIVVLNAALGVIQESKAEEALAALKKMAAPAALVLRDGSQVSVPARELVPGDVVMLEAGNYVPADLRLIQAVNLRIEEASLTGESVPTNKDADVVLDQDIPLGDRRNSAFMGTVVAYGRGRGLVTATGMHTQIGLIAEMLQTYQDETTPLQEKLDQLGRWLGIAALAICGFILFFGIARDTGPATIVNQGLAAYLSPSNRETIMELFMTAVSLAIAAVPEGLPAVVTICLALGMQRMARRNALIRKLPAVETLGSATVICSDKTGTLTQNKMMVVQGWAGGKTFQVTGEGYRPTGSFSYDGQPLDPATDPAISLLLHTGLLCNDAALEKGGAQEGESSWRMVGDPTEGALVVMAAKAGLWRAEVEKALPRMLEIPFDSERKHMTTVHQVNDKQALTSITGNGSGTGLLLDHSPAIALVKGAPDVVLGICDRFIEDGVVQPLTEERRQQVLALNGAMASQALRVLSMAYRPLQTLPDSVGPPTAEQNLIFVGMTGMIDPPRAEVKAAVEVAKGAGLKTVMITGDYRDTAVAVAGKIGLCTDSCRALIGTDLDRLTDEELAATVEQVDAYARVSPQHKVRIVEALRAREHVVAMTGDGVNDAPALKRADIGIAMGITGTDVSRETADIVLTDDNYASIVSAIEEGRIIYSNIRKFVFYLVSCNVGEILVILFSMLGGLPVPLRPIQLLWLNLVTDGAPALALGLEKGDPDTMKQPPRPVKEPVINREMRTGIVVQSLVMAAAVLLAFLYGLRQFPGHLQAAQTVAYATLVLSELLRVFAARSERYSAFAIGLFSNPWMVRAVGFSFVLLMGSIYVPFLQPIFGTVPLGVNDWLVIVPLAFLTPIAAEVNKFFVRRQQRSRSGQA